MKLNWLSERIINSKRAPRWPNDFTESTELSRTTLGRFVVDSLYH
jgi:hypothetical protein